MPERCVPRIDELGIGGRANGAQANMFLLT